MKIRVSTIIFACLLGVACRKHTEPQYIAGYITAVSGTQITLDVPDSIPSERLFAIDDNTICDENSYYEGNIAEVLYNINEEENEHPTVISITADPTYPRMLGRWQTDKDDKLQIDIVLQTHGKILQVAPSDILHLHSWQLTGNEDEITLHGTLSLPPVKNRDKKKEQESNNEIRTTLERRTMHFSATARLADDEEGNTEQHKVLIVTTDKGRRSKLYPAGE